MKFCFHDWDKWSEPLDTAHDYKKVQSRHCKICNKVQVSKMNQPFNLWFGAKEIQTKMETPRSWNGLTLEDKQAMLNDNYGGSRADIMDKTEAILKARNT